MSGSLWLALIGWITVTISNRDVASASIGIFCVNTNMEVFWLGYDWLFRLHLPDAKFITNFLIMFG